MQVAEATQIGGSSKNPTDNARTCSASCHLQIVTVIGSAFLLLGWLVTEHFPPWLSWHSEVVVFFGAILTAWIGLWRAVVGARDRDIALPRVLIPVLVLGALAVLHAVFGLSTYFGNTVVFTFYVGLVVAAATLGYSVASTPSVVAPQGTGSLAPFTVLAVSFLSGGILSSIVGLAQALNVWEHTSLIVHVADAHRPGGNMGQANHLATLAVMALASLAFLKLTGRIAPITTIVLGVVLCLGVSLSGSRSGALSVLLLSAWLYTERKNTVLALSARWPIGLLGVFALFTLLVQPGLDFLQVLRLSSPNRLMGEFGPRLTVWPQLIEAVSLRFWFGWGIGETAPAHNAVAHAYMVSAPFTYSHNIFLDLALWVGVPLAVGLTTLVAVGAWQRIRLSNHVLAWYCLAITLPFAVHCMFEFPFAYAYFLAPVAFFLGALEGSLGIGPMLRLPWRWCAALLVTFTFALSWSVAEYMALEEDFRIARFEAMRLGSTPPTHTRPRVFLLTQLGQLVIGTRVKPHAQMAPEQLHELRDLALHYPWIATQYRYALALALNGNESEAARQFKVIRAHHGSKTYERIKAQFLAQAASDFPQLLAMKLP